MAGVDNIPDEIGSPHFPMQENSTQETKIKTEQAKVIYSQQMPIDELEVVQEEKEDMSERIS